MTKEKEVILQLLEKYKEMPYLWDKSHKQYKNKCYRNEGQQILLEIYKEFEPNATLKTMTKKIQNLRTNYIKEHRKVKDSNRTGAGVDKIYVPTLYYYDALNFLEAYIEPCHNARNTLKSEVNETIDYDIINDEEEIETDITDPLLPPFPSQRTRVFNKKSKNVDHNMLEKVHKLETGENKRNEFSGFAEHIANKLSKYDAYTRAQAEFKIMKVLYECDMGIYRYPKDTQSPDNDSRGGTSQSE